MEFSVAEIRVWQLQGIKLSRGVLMHRKVGKLAFNVRSRIAAEFVFPRLVCPSERFSGVAS